MIWILLAKLSDPVVIVLGLVGGRLSKTWLAVGIVAAVLAAASALIFGLLGGPMDGVGPLGDLLAAALWTAAGFGLRSLGRKKAVVVQPTPE